MEFKYGREWFLCIISVIGFMYQRQVKHVSDKGHFRNCTWGVYKYVGLEMFIWARLLLSLTCKNKHFSSFSLTPPPPLFLSNSSISPSFMQLVNQTWSMESSKQSNIMQGHKLRTWESIIKKLGLWLLASLESTLFVAGEFLDSFLPLGMYESLWEIVL